MKNISWCCSQDARGNGSYEIFSGSVYLFALVPKIVQQKVHSCLNARLSFFLFLFIYNLI